MKRLQSLKEAKTKPDLAKLLGIKPSALTYCLYVLKPESQYTQFEIPKKNSGERIINAPYGMLKTIQSSLSRLLLDCLDEIVCNKFPDSELAKEKAKNSKVLKIKCSSAEIKQPSLSHGFERKRSIITNAMMHLGQKYVFNIDLENFFGSFNFGRVRGFFIKNRNFSLVPEIATVIAKIACYNNELPQGSPCSPVITNLITHSLDIKLAAMAKKNSSTYTRYADDITFSTRKSDFPSSIAKNQSSKYVASKKLRNEIIRSGFVINNRKTRNQYKDSRQDVTGLVVNKKPNTKKEYWRLVRAQCDHLFKNGEFVENIDDKEIKGNINRLEGKLNFIDQIDHYNRLRQGEKLNPKYHLKKDAIKNGQAKVRRYLHSARETTFSKFLFYRLFYGNDLPTILTEGKTDNIYLKAAIHKLASHFPKLAVIKSASSPYKILTKFVDYNERTKYLLELYGGADYLKDFVINYKKHFKYYKAPKPSNPVIIFVDNDNGPRDLINYVNKVNDIKIFPTGVKDIRSSEFVHIFHNLYLVLTPQVVGYAETDIEHFFKDRDRLKLYKGKFFNTVSKRDPDKDLSKEAFATHIVHAQKHNIDFNGFISLLERLVKVIDHYDSVK
ncbi:retron Ec67 family RNA-directed DNA polymerase/endonuclease [Xenorhabdus bovienii]|uniref:retron Ec67 family RNA-directed DNA polymerase/endonuclease n=1 Tax=Xenorhabdus bovienii TaxID=40576 RepID=UPI0023B28E78|nr:retron Ec67 family RNA-directed DNA polymerase/endonuclease [Xenorhabdus bovienii]MDE9465115.1 retron Ec67 family RNA-directed DNA polymerase/endonuclease [Xenorhabdus bovienii]MDE9485580.1 retron Ec67 family RNA-directed DNA polymerase/endonuclease [Xenorhabdus bovienii]